MGQLLGVRRGSLIGVGLIGPPKTPRLRIRTRQRRQIPMPPLGFTACRRPINSVLRGSEFVKFLLHGSEFVLHGFEVVKFFRSLWVWVCEIFSWWFSSYGLEFVTCL